jgi:hypothetical protein
MMTTVLTLNSQQSVILCVISETSMRTFLELKWPIPGGERKLANEKIRSRCRPIAAGFRGGWSRSVKSHYITYDKPQYTI